MEALASEDRLDSVSACDNVISAIFVVRVSTHLCPTQCGGTSHRSMSSRLFSFAPASRIDAKMKIRIALIRRFPFPVQSQLNHENGHRRTCDWEASPLPRVDAFIEAQM